MRRFPLAGLPTAPHAMTTISDEQLVQHAARIKDKVLLITGAHPRDVRPDI